jgi:hypothetical protein
MAFESELEVAVKLVTTLRDPILRLRNVDRGLAEYLRRASHNLAVALNEARWHDGQEQVALLRQACENLSEVYSALQLAETWGYLDGSTLHSARALLDLEQDLLSGPRDRKLAG